MKRSMFIMMATVLMLPSQYSYAQNWIRIARSSFRRTPQTVVREIRTPIGLSSLGHSVGIAQRPNRLTLENDTRYVYWKLERQIAKHTLKPPTELFGPYNDLRAFSTIARQHKEMASHKSYWEWRNIQRTQGYNGVHHLISKATIKRIHADLKSKGYKYSLQEMENNAPAIFHPLHGHPDYQDIFHDIDQQYYDYQKFGMKITVASLLERIDEVNISVGLPPMEKDYLEGILLETELWCKLYHIDF